MGGQYIAEHGDLAVHVGVVAQGHLHLAHVEGGLVVGVVLDAVHNDIVQRKLLGQV